MAPAAVLADKAYDANALLACIANKQAKAVIPPRATRKVQRQFDRHQYRNRNVIERFFARIKHFRRVATRYDKLASRFASFVALTASLLWLLRFPRQTGHLFHGKSITDSTANWTPGPAQTGQQFRVKLDSLKRPERA